MKKRLNLVTVVMFVIALAALMAAVKIGHPIKGGYGFFAGL